MITMMMMKKRARYLLMMSIDTQFTSSSADISIDLKQFHKNFYLLNYAYLIINLIFFPFTNYNCYSIFITKSNVSQKFEQ
jgi:hypothetical protein